MDPEIDSLMIDIETDSLLMRAKQRDLSDRELEEVKSELLDPETTEDRHRLLYIIGRGGDPRFLPVVEPFLDSPDDPMLASLALEILCNFWGLYEKYRDVTIKFMRGVPWDEDKEVMDMAISCAGQLLRERRDPELARMLLEIAEWKVDDEITELTRDWAMFALGRAVGLSWKELPPVPEGLKPDSDLGRMILERARLIVK
ncbi:MAG: hypothetical protein ACREJP_06505 [Candidatus Methylomirabilales bacterium]